MLQSLTTGNILFSIRKFTIYTSNMSGYPRSPAAQRSSAPWRGTTSGLRQRSASGSLQQLCQHICQSVNVYTDQKSIFWLSKSRSAAQLTEWSLATLGLTRHECYHPLVLLAAMLTLLLAHIPPLSGCCIVYILSQDCFGLFSQLAITISPLCSK